MKQFDFNLTFLICININLRKTRYQYKQCKSGLDIEIQSKITSSGSL